MRQHVSTKQRKAFEIKMSRVFGTSMRMLSNEMKDILVDDLVTAFLNRLDVLARAENKEHTHDIAIRCSYDNFELIHNRPKNQS